MAYCVLSPLLLLTLGQVPHYHVFRWKSSLLGSELQFFHLREVPPSHYKLACFAVAAFLLPLALVFLQPHVPLPRVRFYLTSYLGITSLVRPLCAPLISEPTGTFGATCHTIPHDKGAASKRTQESARSPQLPRRRSQIVELQRAPPGARRTLQTLCFPFRSRGNTTTWTSAQRACAVWTLSEKCHFQSSDDTQAGFPPLAQVERKVMPFGARCHLSKVSGGFPTRENLYTSGFMN